MSVVKLKGKRAALRKMKPERLVEVVESHKEKPDPYEKLTNLLSQLLEKQDFEKVVSAVREIKVEVPDQSSELNALSEKLDKIAVMAGKETEHSNADVVEALGKVEKSLKSIKIEQPEREPMITGFSVSGRDLLGRIQDIELVRD